MTSRLRWLRRGTAAGWGLFGGAYAAHLLVGFQPPAIALTLWGVVDLYWRGFLAAVVILWGGALATTVQKRLDPTFDGWQLVRRLPSVVLGAVIGGRLALLLFPPPSLGAAGVMTFADALQNLPVALNLRQGGLHPAGVVLGGALVLALWRLLNPGVIYGFVAGQSFLLWAHFFEQSYVGPPTALPWGMTVDPLHRLPHWELFDRFHPLFLYESLLLLLFSCLWPRLMPDKPTLLTAAARFGLWWGVVRGGIAWWNPNTFLLVWGEWSVPVWSLIWWGSALIAGGIIAYTLRKNEP